MDNAGENKMLARCCDENEMGVKFECTAPGTLQQNGVVEEHLLPSSAEEEQ